MKQHAVLVLGLLKLTLAASANDVNNGDCRPITLVFARGTSEDGNLGRVVGPGLAVAMKDAFGDDAVAVQGLDYPAVLGDAFRDADAPENASGAANMALIAQRLAKDCPDSRIVLAGYAQGATQVRGALMNMDRQSNVMAAITFGDLLSTERFANIPPSNTRVNCVDQDPICRGRRLVNAAHLSYARNGDIEDSVLFVQDVMRASNGNGGANGNGNGGGNGSGNGRGGSNNNGAGAGSGANGGGRGGGSSSNNGGSNGNRAGNGNAGSRNPNAGQGSGNGGGQIGNGNANSQNPTNAGRGSGNGNNQGGNGNANSQSPNASRGSANGNNQGETGNGNSRTPNANPGSANGSNQSGSGRASGNRPANGRGTTNGRSPARQNDVVDGLPVTHAQLTASASAALVTSDLDVPRQGTGKLTESGSPQLDDGEEEEEEEEEDEGEGDEDEEDPADAERTGEGTSAPDSPTEQPSGGVIVPVGSTPSDGSPPQAQDGGDSSDGGIGSGAGSDQGPEEQQPADRTDLDDGAGTQAEGGGENQTRRRLARRAKLVMVR